MVGKFPSPERLKCWHLLLIETRNVVVSSVSYTKETRPGWGHVVNKNKACVGVDLKVCINAPHVRILLVVASYVETLALIRTVMPPSPHSEVWHGSAGQRIAKGQARPITAKASKTISISSWRRDRLLMRTKRTKTNKYESPLCISRGVHVWKSSSAGHTGDASSSSSCG